MILFLIQLEKVAFAFIVVYVATKINSAFFVCFFVFVCVCVFFFNFLLKLWYNLLPLNVSVPRHGTITLDDWCLRYEDNMVVSSSRVNMSIFMDILITMLSQNVKHLSPSDMPHFRRTDTSTAPLQKPQNLRIGNCKLRNKCSAYES